MWDVSRKIFLNFELLSSALQQTGPWQNTNPIVTIDWFIEALKAKIQKLDWETTKQDVARFLRPRELATLEFWSEDFFLSRAEKLAQYLKSGESV